MSTDIAEVKQQQVSAPPQQALTVSDMWSSMVAMAKDPDIDADKIGHLVSMQESMIDRAAKDAFNRAFAQACRDMPVITKDDKIEHNGKFIGWFKKYEDLRHVVDAVINPLGLSITHDSAGIDGGKGGLLIWTVITYMDDQYTWQEDRGKMPVPPDGGGAKGPAQALGSSSTYGQRYSLQAAFGIVQKGLDRDGSTNIGDATKAPGGDWQVLVDNGQIAASRGSQEYELWFKALTNMQRGWLVDNDHHSNFKRGAEAADQG